LSKPAAAVWRAADAAFSSYAPFRDQSCDRWHRKAQVTSGKTGSVGSNPGGRGENQSALRAFDQSLSQQVRAAMRPPDRLVNRSRPPAHLAPRRLGEPEVSLERKEKNHDEDGFDDDVNLLTADARLDDRVAEVYEDADFYEQALKEFLETRGAGSNLGASLGVPAASQPPKRRKQVDRRASKGRKLRYHVQQPLVNFCAPVELEVPGGRKKSSRGSSRRAREKERVAEIRDAESRPGGYIVFEKRKAVVFIASTHIVDCMYRTVRASTRVEAARVCVSFVCRVVRRSLSVIVKQAVKKKTVFFSSRRSTALSARLHLGHAVLVQDAGEEGLGDVVAVVQCALERARAGLDVAAHAAPCGEKKSERNDERTKNEKRVREENAQPTNACSRRHFRVPRRRFRETREREGRGFRGPSERAARRGRGGAPSSLLPTHRSRTARIRGRSCPSGTS
jgi:hypothetical protein